MAGFGSMRTIGNDQDQGFVAVPIQWKSMKEFNDKNLYQTCKLEHT